MGGYEDKLICHYSPGFSWKQRFILPFFLIYAKAKSLTNLTRGRSGCNRFEGWREAEEALARATPRTCADKKGPSGIDAAQPDLL